MSDIPSIVCLYRYTQDGAVFDLLAGFDALRRNNLHGRVGNNAVRADIQAAIPGNADRLLVGDSGEIRNRNQLAVRFSFRIKGYKASFRNFGISDRQLIRNRISVSVDNALKPGLFKFCSRFLSRKSCNVRDSPVKILRLFLRVLRTDAEIREYILQYVPYRRSRHS